MAVGLLGHKKVPKTKAFGTFCIDQISTTESIVFLQSVCLHAE